MIHNHMEKKFAHKCKQRVSLVAYNHRYKQIIEKKYILEQLISKQQATKVKQNEKIQEVH